MNIENSPPENRQQIDHELRKQTSLLWERFDIKVVAFASGIAVFSGVGTASVGVLLRRVIPELPLLLDGATKVGIGTGATLAGIGLAGGILCAAALRENVRDWNRITAKLRSLGYE